MNLTVDLLNEILEIFQQFGLRRMTPVEVRWQTAFPEATTEEFHQWRVFCEGVEAYALELARQVQGHHLDELSALRALTLQYPVLTPARIGDTYNQAKYYALN